MATYTGYKPDSNLFGYGQNRNDRIYVRPSWGFHWGQNWGGDVGRFTGWGINWGYNWGGSRQESHIQIHHKAAVAGGPVSGTYTNNRPISLRGSNHTGYWGGGHVDVFYNRILIEPTAIDFGNVLSTQIQNFIVWNAYFVSKQLTTVNEIDLDEGTEFSGDTFPRSYYPLEEEQYSVTATVNGPPNIDASLIFDWLSPIGDITVTITGSRTVLLPVTFRSRVIEQLIWKTDVLNAYDGTEQRVRVRISPRQQLMIQAYLDRYEMHRIENLVYGWRKRTWAVPMWIEARKIDSSVTAGDTIINVDTQWGDFRANGLAVIWAGPNDFDVFQILSYTATTITVNRGISYDFDVSAYVMPVRSCRMLRDPVRTASGHDAILETALEVTDNTMLSTSPSTTQWDGEDTYFEQPLATDDEGVNDTYEHRIDALDFGAGVVNWDAPWDNIRLNREFDLVLESAQEIWEHREWLHRRAGRLRPFYMPTFENNFKLLSEGNVADTFLAVKNEYSTQSIARSTICFKMTDGSYEIRTVTDADINLSDELEVTFSPNLDEDASDIDEINFFGLKRLSTDRIQLEWYPNSVVLTTVPMTEIKP